MDRGYQYSPVIFYQNKDEEVEAKKALNKIKEEGKFREINVKLIPFEKFYVAEEYHQDYYKKHNLKYNYYRYRSGRDQFLEKVWGK